MPTASKNIMRRLFLYVFPQHGKVEEPVGSSCRLSVFVLESVSTAPIYLQRQESGRQQPFLTGPGTFLEKFFPGKVSQKFLLISMSHLHQCCWQAQAVCLAA